MLNNITDKDIDNNIDNNVPIKKKRGRKPKIRTPEEIEAMKLKEKNKSKRGRKPKGKFKETTTNTFAEIMNDINTNKNIIIKLPLTCEELTQEFNLDTNLKYTPNIPEPIAYNDNDNSYNLNIEEDINSENKISNNISNTLLFNNENNKHNENIQNNDLQLDLNIDNNIDLKDNNIDTNVQKLITNSTKTFKDRNKNLKQIDILINNKYRQITEVDILNYSSDNNNKFSKYPSTTNAYCYWCCHSFKNKPWGIPIKYNIDNNYFICFGNFCSPNCTLAYINEKYGNNTNKWEYISLLNFLYYLSFNNDDIIQPAPDKFCLTLFGGKLSIEEFRLLTLNNKNIYFIRNPICFYIKPILEQKNNNLTQDSYFIPKDEKTLQSVNTKYKIKRNKPIYAGKNTLEKCLFNLS